MKKQAFVLIIMLVFSMTCSLSVFAQQAINSSGGTGIVGNVYLDWCIGETSVKTLNSSVNIVSQGLLQPDPNYAFPVTLIYFSGKSAGAENELNWATSEETDNDYFEVERAAGGIHFAVIGRVDGSGSYYKTKTYSLTDTAPLLHSYYRLKQVDFDGTFSYSSIIYVKQARSEQLSLFPNPTTGVLNLSVRGNHLPLFIAIYDRYGRRMLNKSTDSKDVIKLHVDQLSTGTYFIRVEVPGSENTWSALFFKL